MTPPEPLARPPLLEELLAIHHEQRTGLLDVVRFGVRTILYFKAGTLVFAEQGTLGETLGRIMLEKKLLTEEQYATVIERMTDAIFQSEGMRFGEVAIQLGFIGPEIITEALREQTRRKFLNSLDWVRAQFQWEDAEEAVDEVAHFPSPFDALLLDGIRATWSDEQYAALLAPLLDLVPVLLSDPAELIARFGWDSRALRLLRRVDGVVTLRGLLEPGPMRGHEVRAVLAALLLFADMTVAERVLTPQPAAVPAAPAAPVPSPKAVVRPPAPAARAAAPAPDVRRSRLEAESAFLLGKQHLAASHLQKAAEELRRAATLYPEAIEYELYASWVEMRLTRSEDPRERRRALHELAVRAIEADRKLAIAHHVLGHVLLAEQDLAGALDCFLLARELDPTNSDAEDQIRLLRRREPAPAPAQAAAKDRPAERPKPRSGGAGPKKKPDDKEKVLDELEILRATGEHEASLRLLREALRGAPADASLKAETALSLMLANPRANAREAQRLAREARDADPALPIPYVVLGMLLEQVGDAERAKKMFRAALVRDPDCTEAQRRLG